MLCNGLLNVILKSKSKRLLIRSGLKLETAEHSVQPTSGILRDLRAFF
jgi:hypothetical protein